MTAFVPSDSISESCSDWTVCLLICIIPSCRLFNHGGVINVVMFFRTGTKAVFTVKCVR